MSTNLSKLLPQREYRRFPVGKATCHQIIIPVGFKWRILRQVWEENGVATDYLAAFFHRLTPEVFLPVEAARGLLRNLRQSRKEAGNVR